MSGGIDKTGEPNAGSILHTGPDNQQQEVTQLSPMQELIFLGAPDINSTNDNFSPTGENPENLLQHLSLRKSHL